MISSGLQARGHSPAPVIPYQSLKDRYGFVAGTLNMFSWSGCDGKTFYGGHTDWINIETALSDASFGVKTGIGTITTGLTAPDGTPTASKVMESAAGGNHALMEQSESGSAWHPIPYRMMVIAAPAERTRIVVEFSTQDDAASAGFDLVAGTVFDTVNSTKVAITATAVDDLGGGWKACKIDVGYTAATGYAVAPGPALRPQVYLDNGAGNAARSISYTGDTSKGVLLWLWHCLPKAAYTAISSRVFHDDFFNLSTVDLAATYAAGFNWYLGNNFTNILWQHVGQVFETTPPSAITLDRPSVMKMYKLTPAADSNQQWTTSLMTICQAGASPPPNINGVIGKWWALPALLDCSYALDARPLPGGENSHVNNTSIWSQSVEVFITQGLGPNNEGGAWNPVDGFSNFQGKNSYARSISEFTEVPPHVDPLIGHNCLPLTPFVSRNKTPNPASFVRSSTLWLTSTTSGGAGWGTILFFDDGKNSGDLAYSTTAASHPASSDGNVVGYGKYAEAQHYPIFLWGTAGANANLGAPLYVDWVSVWK